MAEDFERFVKFMKEKEVDPEKAEALREYDFRYKLICWLYMEHFNKNYVVRDGDEVISGELRDFQFSPAGDLSKTSVYSVLRELVRLQEQIESGETIVKSLEFGDLRWQGPVSGKEKKGLTDE